MMVDNTAAMPMMGQMSSQGGALDATGPTLLENKDRKEKGYEPSPSERAFVKEWLKKISSAEDKWAPDYERMKECMEFVNGYQWEGQQSLKDPRYVNNVTLKLVNQKVATLYARNPEAEIVRRKRLDFAVWDGTQEMLMAGVQAAMSTQQTGQMVQPEVMSLLNDYQQGRAFQKMVDGVCKTLDCLYQYEVEQCRPDFKEQAKSLVRRAVTCGVGYIRVNYINDSDPRPDELSTVETRHSFLDRAKRAKQILEDVQEDESDLGGSQVEELKSLFMSMGVTQATGEENQTKQRIEFDFPSALAVVPDPRCRALRDFVGARWIAIKYNIPLDDANAFFGTDIEYTESMQADEGNKVPVEKADPESSGCENPEVTIYEVLDYRTKTHFYLCKGWHCFVLPPEVLDPSVSGFWNIFALTLNDTESDDTTKMRTSIFPLSDVFLVMDAQRERNRSRDALRDHRVGNAPITLIREGLLTEEDVSKLENRVPNSVIELRGIPPDTKPSEFLIPCPVNPIDPALYDTGPVQEDMQFATGVQEANMGPVPATPRVTATGVTVAEQSRMTVSSSNVDDLDGVLSRTARASVEMMLKAFPKELVTLICGPGTVWPESDIDSFINFILISVKASSSGRPNKAVETANFRELAPILQNSGANPIALIEEGVKRMDDRLDVQRFFPVPGLAPLPAGGPVGSPPQVPQQGPANVAPSTPPGVVPNGGAPVPLAAA